jgi:Sulfotransferase family
MRLTALFKVALMIFFRAPEGQLRLDLRHDWPIETSVLLQLAFRGFGGRSLLRRMIKDHGSILLSNIGPLPIQRRRIVVRPENIKQLVVTDLRWIELHFHHFGVAGFVRANIFIRWIILHSARVPDRGRDHALQFAESFLHSPETTCAKGGFLRFHPRHDGTIVRGAQLSFAVRFCCLTVVARRIRIALKSDSRLHEKLAASPTFFHRMNSSATTLEQTRSLLPVRLLNGWGALLEKTRIPRPPVLAPDLIETAMRRCGLSDFGRGDFLEALSRLLESCQCEPRLNLIGRIALRADLLRILCSRLFLERDRQLYPGIARQEIREPLFIVGLPRSGTTLLHTLLAADPEHRVPLIWEVMTPSPPTSENERQRIRRATQSCNCLNWLAPTFRHIHPLGAELPQECVGLMTPTFLSDQFDTMYYVPSYRAWFLRQDLLPAYKYHRRFLQHLQFRRSAPRWVLKAPTHMFALPTLLSVYPDALFVQAHRAPLEAMASVSSLITILRRVFSDSVDPFVVCRDAIQYWSETLDKFLQERDRLEPRRICDLAYSEIRGHPIAAVRRIYVHFGWSLTREAEQRMRVVLANQPQEQHGFHRYNLSQFGLQAAEGEKAFAPYCERFGLSTQAAGKATGHAEGLIASK